MCVKKSVWLLYMERSGPLKEHLPLGVDPGNQILHLEGEEEGGR